jgi:hypothetical protein
MKRMMSVYIRLVTALAFLAVTGSSGYAQGPVGGGMGGQCSVLLQNNTDRPLSFEVSNDQITWIKMTATNGLGADVCLAKEANQKTGDIFVRITTANPASIGPPKFKAYKLLFDTRYEFVWNRYERVWDISMMVPRKSP